MNGPAVCVSDKILERALTDPVLHAALALYRGGRLSYLEAIESAALELSRISDERLQQLIRRSEITVPPMIIKLDAPVYEPKRPWWRRRKK